MADNSKYSVNARLADLSARVQALEKENSALRIWAEGVIVNKIADAATRIQGATGRDGANGKDGAPGKNGKDSNVVGPRGADGKRGDKGDKGDRGDRGEQGTQGKPGRDGTIVAAAELAALRADVKALIDVNKKAGQYLEWLKEKAAHRAS
jgi:hypothetical protein